MTFLAETDPSWVISPWMLILSWILTTGATSVVLVKALSGRAEKREVTINPKPVSEAEFVRHEKDDQEALAKIEHALEQLNTDRKTDVREIHRRIDQVDREVSANSKVQEVFGQRLVQIDTKLDRLIERQIA